MIALFGAVEHDCKGLLRRLLTAMKQADGVQIGHPQTDEIGLFLKRAISVQIRATHILINQLRRSICLVD